MAVMHMCQWGHWGVDASESCDEANVYVRNMDDDGELTNTPLDHSSCGLYLITEVDTEFVKVTEGLDIDVGDLET